MVHLSSRFLNSSLERFLNWCTSCPEIVTTDCQKYVSHSMTKPTKWLVCPAKTQINQGICPVWSEYLLCAQWLAKDPSFPQVDSEDPDQTGRTGHFVGFVMPWFLSLSVVSAVRGGQIFVWGVALLPSLSLRYESNTGDSCYVDFAYLDTITYVEVIFHSQHVFSTFLCISTQSMSKTVNMKQQLSRGDFFHALDVFSIILATVYVEVQNRRSHGAILFA